MLKFFAIATIALLPVMADANCVSDVDALAGQQDVASTLPHVSGNAADTSEKLAASGGVIAAPATGDATLHQPAVPDPEPMQTAPAIPPQTAQSKLKGGGSDHQSTVSGNGTEASSLLTAARQAGVQGDDATCESDLEKARQLLKKVSP